MIAGCIERMRQDACGGCERRDACASIFRALGLDRRGSRPAERPRKAAPANPFLDVPGGSGQGDRRPGPVPSKERARKARSSACWSRCSLGSGPYRPVARALGCSRQTLYRRLKAEGITFAELLDRLRRRLALRFVREQGLSVKEAAYRLGFSDPAAFSRAFKRWTGMSPSEARSFTPTRSSPAASTYNRRPPG